MYQIERDKYAMKEEPQGGEWYISIDYGITNPFAAILWNVSGGRACAVDEYYFDSKAEGRRRTDPEHYEAVERLAGDRFIEAIVIDPSATSFKEQIARGDRFDYINANNDVVNGIAVTSSMLENGDIQISGKCSNLLSEMQLYRWDDKADKDAVIKENDHACDAMRYMANTVLKYELTGYEF